MASVIDNISILQGYEGALASLDAAAKTGLGLASGIDRVYLIGCGGPNRVMLGLQYWIEHYAKTLEVRRYFPAEFMTQNPGRLDGRTLVILGSKSGTTPETVAAAEFLRNSPARRIAVTQNADSPLAKAVPQVFTMGNANGAHGSMFMVMQALIGGLLAGKEGWPLLDKLQSSLRALPQVMIDTAAANESRAAEEARLYKDDRTLYHLAAGPVFTTAYIFGVCVLMEMQWMHSVALEAAEFFHGPFEIVDHTTPLILMKGEDPSRPLMERVERFCKKYTERLMIYDTRDYEMKGIAPEIRPIVGPYVLQAALRRIADRLAVWHNHPLSTRRYMWKTEY
jgi:fructoselysine 6-phosphate deglycase